VRTSRRTRGSESLQHVAVGCSFSVLVAACFSLFIGIPDPTPDNYGPASQLVRSGGVRPISGGAAPPFSVSHVRLNSRELTGNRTRCARIVGVQIDLRSASVSEPRLGERLGSPRLLRDGRADFYGYLRQSWNGHVPGSGSSVRSGAPGGSRYVNKTSASTPPSFLASWPSPVSMNASPAVYVSGVQLGSSHS
jgi:hypothetical protein